MLQNPKQFIKKTPFTRADKDNITIILNKYKHKQR